MGILAHEFLHPNFFDGPAPHCQNLLLMGFGGGLVWLRSEPCLGQKLSYPVLSRQTLIGVFLPDCVVTYEHPPSPHMSPLRIALQWAPPRDKSLAHPQTSAAGDPSFPQNWPSKRWRKRRSGCGQLQPLRRPVLLGTLRTTRWPSSHCPGHPHHPPHPCHPFPLSTPATPITHTIPATPTSLLPPSKV